MCENQDQSDNRGKHSGSASLDWKDNKCVTLALKRFLLPFFMHPPFIDAAILPATQVS